MNKKKKKILKIVFPVVCVFFFAMNEPLISRYPRSRGRRVPARAAREIKYVFMGKLTLFPVCVLFFGSGMGMLVFHR